MVRPPGKVDNCQVGIFIGDVSDDGHTLLDFRLYLPQEWARDEQRRQDCHVPPEIRYQTRQAQRLEMLDAWRAQVPHGCVTGSGLSTTKVGPPSATASTFFHRDQGARMAWAPRLAATMALAPSTFGPHRRRRIARRWTRGMARSLVELLF